MKKTNRAIGLFLAALCGISFTACGTDGGSGGGKAKEIEKYSVNVLSATGGSVTASASEVEQGKDVQFTVTANDGYVLDYLTINGGKVTVTNGEYRFGGVLCDLEVQAKFISPDAIITFDTDGGEPMTPVKAVFGKPFGELPAAVKKGKRFLYWADKYGEKVLASDKVTEGEISLKAVWGEITDKDRENLKPYGATTVYYGTAATKYGVVFHTASEPITPQILLAEGKTEDFSSARAISCKSEAWFDEYVANGVIDGLDYDTEYSVKFGDYSADVWSKTYTFTTKKENVEETKFYYVADTQETYLINNKSEVIGDTYWSVVMTDAQARFPEADFIAHGGDIINHAAEPAYWQEMFDSVERFLFQYPLMSTPGNHEGDGWYSAGYECVGKMFNLDVTSNTEMGFFYSFDYGPMHFVSILSNDVYYHSDGQYTKEQLEWLENDLKKARENTETPWIVAMTHQGIMIPDHVRGKMTSNDYTTLTYPQIMPIFDRYDVDLLLYAHNHYIDSTYPIVWTNEVEETVYDSYMKRNVDYYKIECATKEIRQVEYDGVLVDTFVYPENAVKRGTVMHQTGTTGDQYNNVYKQSESAQNLSNAKYYRKLLSGAKGCISEDTPYSMYSYVEVKGDKLVVRTYGVDVKKQIVSPSLENGVYLDGFMLTK